MSAIIRNAITFTGRFKSFRFWPADEGKQAMLNVTIYDRDSWTDDQGAKQHGDWESIDITYRGHAAEQLNAIIASGTLPEKSCVMGTGHIMASPGIWIDKDGNAHGKIRIAGQTLNPDIIRESNIQQATAREQQQQGQTSPASSADQSGEPLGWGTNTQAPTGAPAPGMQAPNWAAGQTR